MVQWRIDEAARMINAEIITGDSQGNFRGATLDSRRIGGGELFFAVAGEHTDGHRFVADALRKGAAGAVVEAPFLRSQPESLEAWSGVGGPVLRVESGLDALHDLTAAVRREVPERLVAITGSAGKTTTKEMLAEILSSRFKVAKSPGNFNNLYGFPLALLGIANDTEWMVAELGMSEAGELGRLSRLASPDVAVITNVAPAHLEFFGSLRAIAEAKSEILEGLSSNGLLIANADDEEVKRIASRHPGRTVFFGRSPQAHVRAEAVEGAPSGEPGSRFELVVMGRRLPVELPLFGLYNVDNFLAAAACAWALGMSLGDIAAAAPRISGERGRGEVHSLLAGGTLIDDSYNSNPAAVARSLESAAQLGASRRWVVLGDMLELGPSAENYHLQAGRAAARLGFEPVVAVGNFREAVRLGAAGEGARTLTFADAAAATGPVLEELQEGDLLVVKGSRGVRLDTLVTAILARDLAEGQEG